MGAIGMTMRPKCKHCSQLRSSVDEITKRIVSFCEVKNKKISRHDWACKDYKL